MASVRSRRRTSSARDPVRLGGRLGRGDHVQPGLVQGEEGLEDHRVAAGGPVDGATAGSTRGRGSGRWPRRRTGCRGRPARWPGARSWPGPTARLVATVVLPTPPLGETTLITRPVAGRRRSGRRAQLLRRARTSASSIARRSDLRRPPSGAAPGCRMSGRPGADGGQGHLGAGVADQDDAERGAQLVQPARSARGSVRGPSRAVEDHDRRRARRRRRARGPPGRRRGSGGQEATS